MVYATGRDQEAQAVTDDADLERGGSGWLDSFYQFISGAWRIADYAAVRRVVRLS
ncbi:hypothetical protein COMA1_30163 [Candidatus Nitrospira nitrosa]|uniref:Uncharacterized protein n=1 Tax=Candidatus Nitrospira nitrosa TaxID=1742972 RepID=A0A0S4LJ79_9BACT|nr:hypothetical protein COMA1_30163 [Candidatus Nitrospira nitrosa]